MFDAVDDLAKRLPRPDWTGDPINDRRAVAQYIANGRRLRSEALLGIGRAMIAFARGSLHRVAGSFSGAPSHQV